MNDPMAYYHRAKAVELHMDELTEQAWSILVQDHLTADEFERLQNLRREADLLVANLREIRREQIEAALGSHDPWWKFWA